MAPGKGETISCAPGTVIFREGDLSDAIYVIMSGRVEISTERAGQRVVLTTLNPYQIFGELSVLDDSPRSATATAIEATQLMAISREDFAGQLQELSPFMQYWVAHLSERIRDLSIRIGE